MCSLTERRPEYQALARPGGGQAGRVGGRARPSSPPTASSPPRPSVTGAVRPRPPEARRPAHVSVRVPGSRPAGRSERKTGPTRKAPSMSDALGRAIAARLRDVPDFPERGHPVQRHQPAARQTPDAMRAVVQALSEQGRGAGRRRSGRRSRGRGFFFAAAVGYELGCGVVAVRKAGKLPPPTVHAEYRLGTARPRWRCRSASWTATVVLLVDDVLATGRTMSAAADLLEKAGAEVAGIGVVVELAFLGGRAPARATSARGSPDRRGAPTGA